MKILIADKLSKNAITALKGLGGELTVDPELTTEKLPEVMGDHEVLIVRSTKVPAAVMQAAPALKLVIRAGSGFNTIDVDTASKRGVYVSNCPGKNNDAVAELTIGLLIAADRRIVNATSEMRDGKWNKKEYGKARGLKGRTLGIIGLGSIGKEVAKRAQGLGMKVIAWEKFMTKQQVEALGIAYCPTPLDVAEKADAVTVHLALKPETNHFINKEFLSAMKSEAIFINASRGEIVDTAALKQAIKAKKLRVGLDVYENEPAAGAPMFEDNELAKLVAAATPHIGASTEQAEDAVAEEVIVIVKEFKDTGVPVNVVNKVGK